MNGHVDILLCNNASEDSGASRVGGPQCYVSNGGDSPPREQQYDT